MRQPDPPPVYAPGLFLLLSAMLILDLGCTASVPRSRSQRAPAGPPPTFSNMADTASSLELLQESVENDRAVEIADVLPSLDMSSLPGSGINKHKVLDDILAMVGTPYSRSGTDSEGIDCSGFTSKVYSEAIGRPLPHSAAEQYVLSRPVEDTDRAFGDLLFFNTTGEIPSHVGIYLGENLFAHASVSKGVTISSLESSYYKRRYLGARRVNQ
jgi:cell wall-associated NlpC family hydrolase